MIPSPGRQNVWTLWSMGSSISPRRYYLQRAYDLLDQQTHYGNWCNSRSPQSIQKYFQVLLKSTIVETPPWGGRTKDNFLNTLFLAKTSLSAEELLFFAKKIEFQCGRKSHFRFYNREIDLDILYYGKKKINLPHLVIPHPSLNRDYLQVLLFEFREYINKQSSLPDWDEIF